MPVPEEMRQVETEIDRLVKEFPIWNYEKRVLLWRILGFYRDDTERWMGEYVQTTIERRTGDRNNLLIREQRSKLAIMQAYKWTMKFARDGKKSKPPKANRLSHLIELAAKYSIVVDVLQSAKDKTGGIEVDEQLKTVTVYEGADLTGADSQLVYHQCEYLPHYTHVDLTHDADQLTTNWNAGQFRRLVRWLKHLGAEASPTVEGEVYGKYRSVFRKPMIVQIPHPNDPELLAPLHDLTLSRAKVQGEDEWRLASFLDAPLVKIGRRIFGVSHDLVAFERAASPDYMLRIASRTDPDQYSKTSGLREQRMMDLCRKELEKERWRVSERHRLAGPPPREIDLLAHRDDQTVLLELKSTLRPETPWESHNRNQDVLKGIAHTSEVAGMLPTRPLAFVITDGYRGDHVTWKPALDQGIPIGTLRDVCDIAVDPVAAVDLLKERVGFKPGPEPDRLRDRLFEILGWKIKIVDALGPHAEH